MTPNAGPAAGWLEVADYHYPGGWDAPARSQERPRWCCQQLEEGQILFFNGIPFDLSASDREFLLAQQQSDSQLHKNISYRPREDVLRGFGSSQSADVQRLQSIMRSYSAEVTRFLAQVLTPYADQWSLDYASFRPEQEAGRDLPLHKRNDLLHVDAFPTRPTHGGRILRVFTNINPTDPRIWLVADRFPALAQRFATDAGLAKFASAPRRSGGGPLAPLKRAVGLKSPDHSRYDRFMLRFHDYLKENTAFQQDGSRERIEFPPLCTWMVFTDSVPHAVLSGQFALEQTFIIPVSALLAPAKSPLAILEQLCGQPLASGAMLQV